MRRVGLLAQGQFGNNLFVLSYALYALESATVEVTIYTESTDFIFFCEKSQILEGKKLRVENWPLWMKIYLRLYSKLLTRPKISHVNLIERLFRFKSFSSPWDIPTLSELNRWNMGYFQDATPAIRVQQELKNSFAKFSNFVFEKCINTEIASLARNKSFTAVHLRRGDYRKIPEYGTISLEFTDLISLSKNSTLVVSSDDPRISSEFESWKDRINLVDVSHLSAIEALVILADASKLYISNSTFSWWIGFFAELRGNQVVSPIPWFKSAAVPKNFLQHPRFILKQAIFVQNEN